jgi:uncharacterized protein (DUF983 family)
VSCSRRIGEAQDVHAVMVINVASLTGHKSISYQKVKEQLSSWLVLCLSPIIEHLALFLMQIIKIIFFVDEYLNRLYYISCALEEVKILWRCSSAG